MLKWEKGRQNSGYEKFLFFGNKFIIPFDAYILKIPQGVAVPPHKDPAPDKKTHFRLNIVLKKAKGGLFICQNSIINNSRVAFFKASKETHSMEKVEKGNIYLLSFGWLF